MKFVLTQISIQIFKSFIILVAFFVFGSAFADQPTFVKSNGPSVAFLEHYDTNGNLVQLEPGGRFYHMAISFQGKWLQAHPYQGVVLVDIDELEKMGTVTEIVRVNSPELTLEDIKPYLGLRYDQNFSWDDDKMYCSELVAKLLNIQPIPMVFAPGLWPPQYQQYNGLPGISPDKIYLLLKAE
ncbi:MAG: YiiX/YebB-like N1pC/P60 family cysteine hydrolase [Bdellovibrionota bacterium]